MTKRCPTCDQVKDVSEFGKAARRPDGLKGQCKACCYAAYLRWLEGDGRKEQVRANQRRRLQNDDGRMKVRRSAYIEKHKEEIRAAQKVRSATWYARNREAQNAKSRAYYEANKEKLRPGRQAYQKLWKRLNRDKALASVHRRLARIKGNGGSYTAAEWRDLCQAYDYRCLSCGRRKPLTIDHVVPISKGGTNDIGNIQPLCLPCNTSKSNKIIDHRKKTSPLNLRNA